MRRVLFDENMPRRLRRELPQFVIRTVQEEGWGSYENGELLSRAQERFEVLVTADRRMQYQQNLTGYKIGVIVLVTPRLRFEVLSRAVAQLGATIEKIQPGEVIQLEV